MELYLVELTVADWRASLAWYRDRLGLRVERMDEANEYVLLAAGQGHIALKGGGGPPGPPGAQRTKGVFVEAQDCRPASSQHSGGPGGPPPRAKVGLPRAAKMVFRVDDLEAKLRTLAEQGLFPDRSIKVSEEGYRSAQFVDLDGHSIEMFEWTNG